MTKSDIHLTAEHSPKNIFRDMTKRVKTEHIEILEWLDLNSRKNAGWWLQINFINCIDLMATQTQKAINIIFIHLYTLFMANVHRSQLFYPDGISCDLMKTFNFVMNYLVGFLPKQLEPLSSTQAVSAAFQFFIDFFPF